MANETQCGIGSVLSKNIVVKEAMLERDSISNNNSHNIVAIRGGSIILNCPFKSYPAAKFSWYLTNKTNEATTTTGTVTIDNTIGKLAPTPIISTGSSLSHLKDNRRVKGLICKKNKNPKPLKYFILSNGSLLITLLTYEDSGRYKCEAQNDYIPKKTTRTAWVALKIEEPSNPKIPRFGLLPPLQEQNLTILTHDVLRLHCASYSEKISWSFTPRRSNIPIPLTDFTNELKYVNVSIDKHDGVYNCSTPSGEYQTFNVHVTSMPVLAESLDSRTTSVATAVSFNCSATGNPLPEITWYRNGKLIENSYVINYETPILRINSVEPEDQGIYECFARNSVGEVKSSGHLTVRKKQQYKDLDERPMNVKCYPADFNTVIIKFESKNVYHMINYYVATKNPYSWQSPPPLEPLDQNTIKITTYIEPLKKYGIYLRGIMRKDTNKNGKSDQTIMSLTRMSNLVECATQGIPVRYTSMSNNIFVWWADTNKLNLSAIYVQFLHNDTMNSPLFSTEIIGTYIHFEGSNNYLTHAEFSYGLVKLPAETTTIQPSYTSGNRRKRFGMDYEDNSRYMKMSKLSTRNAIFPHYNEGTISQVKVTGNVTGILIPNPQNLIIRVLGSTEPDGSLFPQDLKYVPWTSAELDEATPKAKLNILETHARSIRIGWTPLGDNLLSDKCMEVCHKDIIQDFMQRSRPLDCEKIDPSYNEAIVGKLTPLTTFNVFIRVCNSSQPISEILDIITKQDVSGPVSNHNITLGEDGILLQWQPPTQPNGVLLYYLIEWTKDGLDFYQNVSIDGPFQFKFPNTSASDKFNMSIKAISPAGEGIPIVVDLRRHSSYFPDFSSDDSILGIALGILLSIFCIIICIWIFVRNRNCNKNQHQPSNNQTGNNNHSHTSGRGESGQNAVNCTADVHEMQTLIAQSDISTIVANGTVQHYTRPDVTEVDTEIRTLTNEKPKLLKTSPKLNVRSKESGQSFELEPLHSSNVDSMPNGGVMTTFHPEPVVKNGNGILKSGNGYDHPRPNGLTVINGNLDQTTVVKSNGNLRITENPQYLKPTTLDTTSNTSTSPTNFLPIDDQRSSPNNSSIFDTSQQKLLGNSTIDSDIKHNNSNNIKNLLKIDKDKLKNNFKNTSTFNHFNGDGSDENHHHHHLQKQQQPDNLSYDLNTSNLSTKPLTGTSPTKIRGNGWLIDNYRQPIIGPNG
uniref:CSON015462 protein n=1 Tax=Culicoides sonorensis TaxID=179676 RepID=A0A336MHG5_CULSO